MVMLKLIKKDFAAGWIFLGVVTVGIPFLTTIALLAMMDDFGGIVYGFFAIITIFLCTFGSLIFLLIDSSFETDSTYASLPIKRESIILARYFSSFLLTIFSFGIVVITLWVVSSLSAAKEYESAFQLLLSFSGISSVFIGLLFIQAFIFPFIFKFGTGKGLLKSLITITILVVIEPLFKFINNVVFGNYEFDLLFIIQHLKNILLYMKNLSTAELYFVLFIFFVTVEFSSILLSQRFYSKRDL